MNKCEFYIIFFIHKTRKIFISNRYYINSTFNKKEGIDLKSIPSFFMYNYLLTDNYF